MRTIRPGPRRVRKSSAVLMCVAAASMFFVATGLLADPPDSVKPVLREGTFVMRDTTTHPPSPVSAKALERLNANSTEKWNVQWHRTTGLPGIGGGVTKKKYEGSPEEIALAFVEDYKDFFLGIDNPEVLAEYSFKQSKAERSLDLVYVRFRVQFKGIEIHESSIVAVLTTHGDIDHVNNYLNPIQLENVAPSLTQADVEEIIRRAAAPEKVLKPSQIGEIWPHEETAKQIGTKYDEVELVIYPSSPPRLAYYMSRLIGDLRWWRIIVDAHTGQILSAKAPFFEMQPSSHTFPSSADSVGADSSGETTTKRRLLPPPTLPEPGKAYPLPGGDSLQYR